IRSTRRSCRIAIYGDDRPVPFQVDEHILFPQTQGLSTDRAGAGYFAGMAALDHAIVLVENSPYFLYYWTQCARPGSRRFTFLDLETMAVTGTAAAPDCLTRIARSPGSTTEIVGFVQEDVPRLARFTEHGQLIDSRPLESTKFHPQYHSVSAMIPVDQEN